MTIHKLQCHSDTVFQKNIEQLDNIITDCNMYFNILGGNANWVSMRTSLGDNVFLFPVFMRNEVAYKRITLLLRLQMLAHFNLWVGFHCKFHETSATVHQNLHFCGKCITKEEKANLKQQSVFSNLISKTCRIEFQWAFGHHLIMYLIRRSACCYYKCFRNIFNIYRM